MGGTNSASRPVAVVDEAADTRTAKQNDDDLECMCKDLLDALNREQPPDPLSSSDAAALELAASEAMRTAAQDEVDKKISQEESSCQGPSSSPNLTAKQAGCLL